MEQTTTERAFFGPDYRQVTIGDSIMLTPEHPVRLDCGKEIASYPLALRTYGTLNADKSNAVLVFHTMTSDQYIADTNPVTGKPGWWETAVGAGKAVDTSKHFVICANVAAGCMGSWGPKSVNPDTGKPYALSFPMVTMRDMAALQYPLCARFGITRFHAVIGTSMGGMVAMEWAQLYPQSAERLILVATSYRQTPQNIAFNEVGRQAIIADPEWKDGDYLTHRTFPAKGLAVGRMNSHVTFMSRKAIERKFGRFLQDGDTPGYGFDADFRVESYLRYQGVSFAERFDPNSFLYLSRACDYYDLSQHGKRSLTEAMSRLKDMRVTLFSFSTDWYYPTEEARRLIHAGMEAGIDMSGTEINSDKGHDAFLLDEPEFYDTLAGAME